MTTSDNYSSGYIELEGTQLYYEQTGEGHPLVLVHGGLLDRRMWDAQFEEFSLYYHVIRYDVRGFGKSPLGVEPYSNAWDLHDLLSELEIEKTYLLGLSLGGGIAIDFTLEHPEMVDGLILAAASVSGYDNYSPEMVEFGMQLQEAARQEDIERLRTLWTEHEMMPQNNEFPEAQRFYREMLGDYDFGHYLHPAPHQDLNPPAVMRLSEIRVPTLVLIGDNDSLENQATSDLFEAGIIDMKKLTLRGSRHMLNLEQPETFNRAVLTFLRRLDTSK
jgi:pimeloyl-ACP methyl ester carboxylesterase